MRYLVLDNHNLRYYADQTGCFSIFSSYSCPSSYLSSSHTLHRNTHTLELQHVYTRRHLRVINATSINTSCSHTNTHKVTLFLSHVYLSHANTQTRTSQVFRTHAHRQTRACTHTHTDVRIIPIQVSKFSCARTHTHIH